MLFKVAPATVPMPCEKPRDREAFWEGVKKEIPAFVYFLQNFEIPVGLEDSRFGISAFHHPDLVSTVKDMSPETQLLELI